MNQVPVINVMQMTKQMDLHDNIYEHFSVKMQQPHDVLMLTNFFNFIFVRHPFERLVSAFHDKFIVIKQQNLMLPFIKYYVQILYPNIRTPKRPSRKWIDDYVDVSFQNFVNFVLHENSLATQISGPSGHWWPYTDMCKMCEIDFEYIGKLETLSRDVDCILKKFPKYHLLQRMRSRIQIKVNSKGNHTKNMTMNYFSQLPKRNIIELYKMYKDDFTLGGYEYPINYIDVGIPADNL